MILPGVVWWYFHLQGKLNLAKFPSRTFLLHKVPGGIKGWLWRSRLIQRYASLIWTPVILWSLQWHPWTSLQFLATSRNTYQFSCRDLKYSLWCFTQTSIRSTIHISPGGNELPVQLERSGPPADTNETQALPGGDTIFTLEMPVLEKKDHQFTAPEDANTSKALPPNDDQEVGRAWVWFLFLKQWCIFLEDRRYPHQLTKTL